MRKFFKALIFYLVLLLLIGPGLITGLCMILFVCIAELLTIVQDWAFDFEPRESIED